MKHLTLSGTGITDQILSKILKASSELLELHLAQTRISEKCLPEIIGLKKLQYITVPPEDVFGFGRSGVLAIAKSSLSLRTLDCQEGYLFNQEEISQIIHCNCQLSSLIIPFAFVDDSTFTFIIEKLENLTYYLRVRDQRFIGLREPNQNQKAEFRDLLECEPYTIIANI